MIDDSGRVRQIAWLDVFPWLRLLKCPRLSLRISLVLLGFMGWLGMTAGWRFFAHCWDESSDPVVQEYISHFKYWPWEERAIANGLPLRWSAESILRESTPEIGLPNYATLQRASSRIYNTAMTLSLPAIALFDVRLGFSGFCFFLLCTIWGILVWSIFGAAITRIAALALTREHKLGLVGGMKFGLLHWPSFAGGPALPLVACLFLAVPLLMLGWVAQLDIGALFVSVIWPLALLGGGLIALLALGLLLGWPLMWPTISTEATDSFDGLSRSYSYLLHRPLRYFGYVLVAGILGALLVTIVAFVVVQIEKMTTWGFSIGAGATRVSELATINQEDGQGSMFHGAQHVFAFWNHLLMLVPLAVAASYFWTAMTQIYLLLRRDEDGAELDEVFLPAQDKEFGLPPLKHDAAGVPTVAEPTPPTTNAPDDTALGS
jgi:hypothetical protein